MLNLFLLRHAKSDWQSFSCDDFSRDILQKGIDKTKKIGEYIKKENLQISKILCSPSIRTKKTKDIILEYLNQKPLIEYNTCIYHDSNEDLLGLLKLQKSINSLLIIGHEPKLSNLVACLSKDYENKHFQSAVGKYVTSGLFSLSFNTDNWKNISYKNSKIKFYVKPNTL